MKTTATLLLLIFQAGMMLAQDTVHYNCIIIISKNKAAVHTLLYESLHLFPDSTFMRNSEYDLFFQEFGSYTIQDKILQLNYYANADFIILKNNYSNTKHVIDSLAAINQPDRIDKYAIENNRIYILKPNGKRRNKINDPSLPKPMGWLFGNGRNYIYIKSGKIVPVDN